MAGSVSAPGSVGSTIHTPTSGSRCLIWGPPDKLTVHILIFFSFFRLPSRRPRKVGMACFYGGSAGSACMQPPDGPPRLAPNEYYRWRVWALLTSKRRKGGHGAYGCRSPVSMHMHVQSSLAGMMCRYASAISHEAGLQGVDPFGGRLTRIRRGGQKSVNESSLQSVSQRIWEDCYTPSRPAPTLRPEPSHRRAAWLAKRPPGNAVNSSDNTMVLAPPALSPGVHGHVRANQRTPHPSPLAPHATPHANKPSRVVCVFG